jgi:hypothetical protein
VRSVAVVVVGLVLALARTGVADEKALHAYAGQIIVSPDPAPASLPELAAWAKANATKDRRYALIKGSPWEVHLVGVLPKDPGADKVTLVITEAGAKKPASPIATLDVVARRRIVIAKTTATSAAGFEANKTYVLELVVKAKPVARAELELRD